MLGPTNCVSQAPKGEWGDDYGRGDKECSTKIGGNGDKSDIKG